MPNRKVMTMGLCAVMTGKTGFDHRIKALMLEHHIINRGLINCDKAFCGIIFILYWQDMIGACRILAGNIDCHRLAMREGVVGYWHRRRGKAG